MTAPNTTPPAPPRPTSRCPSQPTPRRARARSGSGCSTAARCRSTACWPTSGSSPWLAKTIYLPELTEDSLADLDGLFIPEGSNHRALEQAAGIVRAFLEHGKTVLLFGDQPVGWLPGIAWELRPALAAPKLTAGRPARATTASTARSH